MCSTPTVSTFQWYIVKSKLMPRLCTLRDYECCWCGCGWQRERERENVFQVFLFFFSPQDNNTCRNTWTLNFKCNNFGDPLDSLSGSIWWQLSRETPNSNTYGRETTRIQNRWRGTKLMNVTCVLFHSFWPPEAVPQHWMTYENTKVMRNACAIVRGRNRL